MALHYFTVATFNARNLIRPGVTYYGRSSYSETDYDQKLNWMAQQLLRMDADFVCLQEVFEPEPLEDLAERYDALLRATYSKHKAALDNFDHVWHIPNIDATDGRPMPGLGLLSRRDIVEQHVVQDLCNDPIEVEESEGLTYRLSKLSRPLMVAKVDLGKDVEGWLFNAHLKSKRPKYPSGSTASNERNFEFYERAEGSFRSLALRAGEALALRREVLRRLAGAHEPVIVAGDLNDEVGAVTTEMIAGEAPWRGWNILTKKRFWDVEMYSAVRSHLRRTEHSSIYTHIWNGHYGTIDHVLVSQEFYYRNPTRIGDINFVQCFNDHLTDDSIKGAPGLGDGSDHGQVVVRLSIDPDRLP
ncbi:MAG: endonuclease/exonuclease/phosphatase family protein [Actinomycetota bacterium]